MVNQRCGRETLPQATGEPEGYVYFCRVVLDLGMNALVEVYTLAELVGC
ncbi:hypothetical protein [Nostoc sp.]